MQILTSDTDITKTINVGAIGKASTVTLFGCTFTDLTTTKPIAGAVALDIVIPAPKSVADSTLATVQVDGSRVESFQVITSGIRQFDPRYLVRPFMKEDADLAYGPVLASPASPMAFIDLSTLPKLSAMPATCNFIYYDYVTDTMYYFGAITSLSTVTASTQVWTESFASDPVVDYLTVAHSSGAIGYHFIFTASGKILELFASNTANFKQTRALTHKIKSAVPYYIDSTASAKYGANARVIVLDDKGNLHKYKLLDLTLIGSVPNTNIVKLTGTTGYYTGSGTGTICAISAEPRANVYAVAANIAVAPTLTRQPLNTLTQNMQYIDTFSIGGYSVTGGRWLAYDFALNKLVYVSWDGTTIFGYDFTTDNNLNTLAGRLVYGYSQTASTDGVIRSLYQNLKYTSTKNYVGDKAWNWLSGDSDYSIGRIRKVAKSYLIDGSSYSLSDMPINVKFNGKSLSFKLADSTLTGFKIVLPPELPGTITVNEVASDLTVPSGEVQITFNAAPTQSSYYLAIGHTLFDVSVDGLYKLTVGEVGKNSIVKLYGATFSDDGTTTRNITGPTEIVVSVPVPATSYESNIAEVYVDSGRVAYFTRQPYADETSLKQFNPAYFTRPYLNTDIDPSQGIVRITQSQAYTSPLPTFLRIDTLATVPTQSVLKSCYYDYYTDKMYWFGGSVTDPSLIGAASTVWVEDFSADPLACYQQIDSSPTFGSPNYVAYFILFHKSGKVRLQHCNTAYPTITYTKILPHDIVAGCALWTGGFTAASGLTTSARLIVSDSKGNLYKYSPNVQGVHDLGPAILKGKVVGKNIVKLVSSNFSLASPTVLALSDEARTNAYTVDALTDTAPTLTRQPVNSVTKNMQSVDINPGYFKLLSYNFATNKLRVVNLDGTDANTTYADNFALLSGTGGKFVDSLHPLVVADTFIRSWDRVLPHQPSVSPTEDAVTLIDSNFDYYGTYKVFGYGTYPCTVYGVVANAPSGDVVVESIVFEWTGTGTSAPRYITIYNWNGSNYVVHQQFDMFSMRGPYPKTLTLSTPMKLHSSRKMSLGASLTWNNAGAAPLIGITELNVMIRKA